MAENGTCRAPMAAGILRDCVLHNPVEILSRGLVVLFPEPLNQKAEAVMISNGINLENFQSEQLKVEDVQGDTLILVMEHKQKERVMELLGNAISEEDVQVLNQMIGEELEVMDPYGGSLQIYGLCYESLYKSIKKLTKLLNEVEGE